MAKIVMTRAQFLAARASADKSCSFNLDGWSYTLKFVEKEVRKNFTTEFCVEHSYGWVQPGTGRKFAYCYDEGGIQYCFSSKNDAEPSLTIESDAMLHPIATKVNTVNVLDIDSVSLSCNLEVSLHVLPGRIQASTPKGFQPRITVCVDVVDHAKGIKNFKTL